MKRREFLQVGLAGVAAASFSLIPWKDGRAEKAAALSSDPRRVELLDADWRFATEQPVHLGTAVTEWVWTPGTADQEAAMTAPGLDTSGGAWKKTAPGDSTLAENSGGWFRAVLPEIAGPGRMVHFESVDDNGTVYLNGKKLTEHTGWDSPFEVALDPSWRNGGPNVLAVFVQECRGAGAGSRSPLLSAK